MKLRLSACLKDWGWQLAGGILQLFLGFALLANPGVSMVVLAFFVGFWLLFQGISTISIAVQFQTDTDSFTITLDMV